MKLKMIVGWVVALSLLVGSGAAVVAAAQDKGGDKAKKTAKPKSAAKAKAEAKAGAGGGAKATAEVGD